MLLLAFLSSIYLFIAASNIGIICSSAQTTLYNVPSHPFLKHKFLKSYKISQVDYQNFGAVFTTTVDMPSYTFVNLLNPYLRFERLTYDVPEFEKNGDTLSVSPRTLTYSR